jgi:DDB1- and CUL4-associated factor 11
VPVSLSLNSRVYNGQFSASGDLYICSSQDEIQIYDVSDTSAWTLASSFPANQASWTITDLDISSDQNYVVYSSMCSTINLISIKSNPLNLVPSDLSQNSINISPHGDDFGIFGCKFSDSATEVLLGTKIRTVELFDLIKLKKNYRVVSAHQDDINSVCYLEEGSPVFCSGSDDSVIKLWDPRDRKLRPTGMLVGHREGITCVSSKKDGVQLVSNGKDQCLKYWDIRRMKNSQEYTKFRRTHQYQMNFNYVFGEYPLANYNKKLAEDCSLLTFRGHSVLETLIRCYFSPAQSTGQRYVYSGCASGKVYIYDTYTGNTAAVLKSGVTRREHEVVSRDVSWHPYQPLIAATSFNGNVYQYIF